MESILESCPVGDLQSNGTIEVGVRELKEKSLGFVLENDDPILAWIPTYVTDEVRAARPKGTRDGSQLVSSESPVWKACVCVREAME